MSNPEQDREDYEVVVIQRRPNLYRQVGVFRVTLQDVGGLKFKDPERLIAQMEDAILKHEQRD